LDYEFIVPEDKTDQVFEAMISEGMFSLNIEKIKKVAKVAAMIGLGALIGV